jgi:hypothetical protein
MSTTTVSNSSNNAINNMTFAEGRALEECTGGVNKHALAEAKKQEKEKKQQEAAMKKALKEAEKQRKAEAKAEKDAEKKRKADEKAAKQLEKQRKAEEKEAEKQKKIQEKAAKADAIAKKKEEKQRKNDEKEAEKQRKLHEKALKAEAAAAKKAERETKKAEREAKKAERDAKKAERDAKKVQVTSSPETQLDESKAANNQVECLQNPVSDQEAEKVSEIAINTTNSPIQNEDNVVLDETLVQTSLDLEIPCEVPTNTPVDFGSDEELETNTSSELISKIIKIEEQEECEDKNNTTSDSVDELTEEEWEKEIHGDETDMQKIVRLRKEAFSLLNRARKLEKSLPTNVSDDVEKEKDKDMREIEGIWYHVDTDGYIFNRSDELVGFMDNDEITFTPGWDTTRGTWEYE